jgi:hypothetical protein
MAGIATAGEPCDNIGETYWHGFGTALVPVTEGAVSIHLRVEAGEEDEDGAIRYPFGQRFEGGKLNQSWAKYNAACPLGYTPEECMRALMAPQSMETCAESAEGNCGITFGYLLRTPAMPACTFGYYVGSDGGDVEYVGNFRVERGGMVAGGLIMLFSFRGARVMEARPSLFTFWRHPEALEP